MNSSTSPDNAGGSTTPAEAQPSSPPSDDGWTRSDVDEIRRGLYRIGKGHVARKPHDPSPVYHAFHAHAFLGAFPTADDARAFCLLHETKPC